MAKRRPRKAPNGEGSVFETADGRYKVAVTVGATPDGKPRRRTKIFDKRSEAEACRRELLSLRDAGKLGPASRTTLSEYLASWLRSSEADGNRHTTIASYESVIRNHITPRLGYMQIERLTTRAVRDWLDALDAAGVGGRTRQYAFTILDAALADAVTIGDLTSNACDPIPRPKHERAKVDPFSAEESKAILQVAETRWHPAVYLLGFTAGMRQGEIFGLRPCDVDLEAGTVAIQQQLVESKGGLRIHPPKTQSGYRTLHLTARASDALREHRKLRLRKGWASSDLLFLTRRGTPVRRSNFGDRHWAPVLSKCGLRHRGFHHSRHTWATLMLRSGISLPAISKMLGHAKTSTTLEIYSHYMPEDKQDIRAAGLRLFG